MVETWDVMVPEQWFVVVTDDGMRIQVRTHNLRGAITMVQELLGDESAVMAVWDGHHIYLVEWE